MNLLNFNEGDLPMRDLETIGLASRGQLLLNMDDLKALLSGRRTDMLRLKNLEAENIKIKALDAKISLERALGKVNLVIHPVYTKPTKKPEYLEDFEAAQLVKGEIPSILKITKDDKGNEKEYLVEYDEETREFIVSATEKILVPDMINNEFLTAAQKEYYRKGKEVQMSDNTRLNYSGKDLHGIKSNKLALVASILIDGGISYMVYKGLNAMFNQKHDPKGATELSPGYYNALRDIEDQRPEGFENDTQTTNRGRTGRK